MSSTQQAAESDGVEPQPAAELPALQNLSIQGQGYGEGSRRQSRAHDSSSAAGPGLPGVAQGVQGAGASGQENVNSAWSQSKAEEIAGGDSVGEGEKDVTALPGTITGQPHTTRQRGAHTLLYVNPAYQKDLTIALSDSTRHVA